MKEVVSDGEGTVVCKGSQGLTMSYVNINRRGSRRKKKEVHCSQQLGEEHFVFSEVGYEVESMGNDYNKHLLKPYYMPSIVL